MKKKDGEGKKDEGECKKEDVQPPDPRTLFIFDQCIKEAGLEAKHLIEPGARHNSLKAVLSHGFDGAVLSWNIMEAPLSHMESLKKP